MAEKIKDLMMKKIALIQEIENLKYQLNDKLIEVDKIDIVLNQYIGAQALSGSPLERSKVTPLF